jgi:hypothetical protein
LGAVARDEAGDLRGDLLIRADRGTAWGGVAAILAVCLDPGVRLARVSFACSSERRGQETGYYRWPSTLPVRRSMEARRVATRGGAGLPLSLYRADAAGSKFRVVRDGDGEKAVEVARAANAEELRERLSDIVGGRAEVGAGDLEAEVLLQGAGWNCGDVVWLTSHLSRVCHPYWEGLSPWPTRPAEEGLQPGERVEPGK